jgi:integrase
VICSWSRRRKMTFWTGATGSARDACRGLLIDLFAQCPQASIARIDWGILVTRPRGTLRPCLTMTRLRLRCSSLRCQRMGLTQAASEEAAAFIRGLEFSGARPKELAVATVGDFDGEHLKLSHRKGRPPKLRSRYVLLDEEGIKFFKAQVKDKLPVTRLFVHHGQPWRRDMWAQEIRAAISIHNKAARGHARIPPSASAYSFRHARISELLQVYGVDPLTVGAQTGTSLRMIERTYYKFIPSVMRSKLANPTASPTAG